MSVEQVQNRFTDIIIRELPVKLKRVFYPWIRIQFPEVKRDYAQIGEVLRNMT